MVAELPWLWAGLFAYAVATVTAIATVQPKHGAGRVREHAETVVLWSLAIGVLLLMVAIGARWERIGHGPWINLFELLMSQLWSLGLVYVLLYWRIPAIRQTAVIVLPLMWVLGSWVLILEPETSHFPPTYYNSWKWAHVGLGKVFLGLLLAGVGIAGVLLFRYWSRSASWFSLMPDSEWLDRLAWRLMMLALVFDSLMLIAGAVWAQDAWGRYWAWDALETSSFITWLGIAVGLHLRLTYRIPHWASALMIIGVFVLAFTTYFGVPYLSPAAHKGVV